MRERPILFNAAMVRAILSGAKTQTRRVVKVPWKGALKTTPYEPYYTDDDGVLMVGVDGPYRPFVDVAGCPFGVVGDRLWVRETFACPETVRYYRADDAGILPPGTKWTPSIHMPRWASRLSLTITNVRVQRLQDISDVDAVAEGIKRADGKRYMVDKTDLTRGTWPGGAVGDFAALWDSINGPESWDTNPWVWAITFERGAQ